jgi:hypothetical protein
MSVISARIDDVIARDLALRLKEDGYRKSGRTFYRAAVDHTRVVNVQGNKWNEGDEGSFAINLDVYFPIVAALGGGPAARGAFPKEYECSIRARLGEGAHEFRDHWWSVRPADDVALVARVVGAAWNDYGRSWFEKAATLSGAYEISCQQLQHFPAAIFALALEERGKAALHLERAIERLPRGRPRFEEWGKRHRLIP